MTEPIEQVQALAESEARLAALLGHSREMIFVLGADASVGYCNPAAADFFGDLEPLRAPGGLLTRIHPEDVDRAAQELAARVSNAGVQPFSGYRGLRADGTWRHVEGVTSNLFDDPAVGGLVVNVHDVTDRIRDARLLAAQREVLMRIATGEPLASCLEAVADLVLEQLPGAAVTVSASEGPVDHPLQVVVKRGEALPSDGVERTLSLLARASGDLLGVLRVQAPDALSLLEAEGVLDIAQSVSQIALERQRDLDRLVDMALHDALTGLPNRTLFLDRLRQVLQAERRAGAFTAVLFCDVDNFKYVNDSQGHSLGDELLCEVADRLHGLLRPGDTVARFGGDEFVVLASDLHSQQEALLVAERLVRDTRTPLQVGGLERVVTLSVGLAVTTGQDADADTLVAQADAALYRAKALGKDRAEVFDADLQQLARARLDLDAAMRQALEREEFHLDVQPQVDAVSGHVTCAEVLLRWNRPGHGPVPPASFIPLAEETGVIVPIGEWVLRAACAVGAGWVRQGRPLTLAVNVSARQLTHSDIAGAVQAALADSGLPAQLLRLEVTETAIMEDVEALNDTLARLRQLGVTISIDDFGTGYSSLLYLKRLPVSELKIDGAFVRGLGQSVEDESIVTGIVQLARALGLRTVAEGVETPEQLGWVRRLGCTSAQGYLVGRPMAPEVFWDWAAAHHLSQVPMPRGSFRAPDAATPKP